MNDKKMDAGSVDMDKKTEQIVRKLAARSIRIVYLKVSLRK